MNLSHAFNIRVNEDQLHTKYDFVEFNTQLNQNLFPIESSVNNRKRLLNSSKETTVSPIKKKRNQFELFLKYLENNANEEVIEEIDVKILLINYCEECLSDKKLAVSEKNMIFTSKKQIIQIVLGSLLQNINIEDVSNGIILNISNDPEFLLKVALFCRKELNVRSITNFLLSLAAKQPECRPYLKKYFSKCINIPNDWIEKISESHRLPAQLRNVLVAKFSEFNIYQIGKYKNKEKEVEVNEKKWKVNFKNMVRLLHISSPVDHVMSILGKKYPTTREEFIKSKLTGEWDELKAGKRMKIPIPSTWETKLSLEGNNKETWEQLIRDKSLPYMAMIRNLRNILQSHVDPKYHGQITSLICREKSVINGKMLPLQYFTAFKVLEDFKEDTYKERSKISDLRKTAVKKKSLFKLKKVQKSMISDELIKRYTASLTSAIEISCMYNIPPIRGKLLILADVSDSSSIVPTKFGFSKPVNETVSLMVSLCCFAAEYSEIFLLRDAVYQYSPERRPKSLLPMSKEILNYNKHEMSKSMLELFMKIINNMIYFDTIILFDVNLKDEFLLNYLNSINKDVKIYKTLSKRDKADTTESSEESIYDICGFNEQTVRIISEQSHCGIVEAIDKIDQKYDLDNINSELSVSEDSDEMVGNTKLKRNIVYNVFLSSTFKDMKEERNYINMVAIPGLRQKLRKQNKLTLINCLDLQWGIPEEWADGEKILEHCIEQVLRCDLFVGIYGHRYGWIPKDHLIDKLSKKYPEIAKYKGLSITHIEYKFVPTSARKILLVRADGPGDVSDKKVESFWDEMEKDADFANETPGDNLSTECMWYQHFDNFKELWVTITEEISQKIDSDSNNNFKHCIVHDRDLRFEALLHYQEYFIINFSEHKDFSQREEMKEVVKLVEINLESEAIHCRDEINRKAQQDSRKIENSSSLLDLPGGIVFVSGESGSGKSSLLAALAKEMDTTSFATKYNLKPSKHLIYIWSYEYVKELNQQMFKELSLLDLITDIIEFFIRTFHDMKEKLKCRLRSTGGIDINQKYFWIHDNLQTATVIWRTLLNILNFSSNIKITIFLDGLEKFENSEVTSYNWLPLILPTNLRFITTVYPSLTSNTTENRKFSLTYTVKSIPHHYRRKVLEKVLLKQGKILSDTSFNNQMGALVLKTDSGKPVYLEMALHFLKCRGNFENLTSLITTLPSNLPKLISLSLESIENDIPQLISVVYLSFISASKDGFRLEDLQALVSIYFKVAIETKNNYFTSSSKNIIEECSKSTTLCPVYPFLLINNLCYGIVNEDNNGYFTIQNQRKEVNNYIQKINKPVILLIVSEYFKMLMSKSRDRIAYMNICYYMFQAGQYEDCFQLLIDLVFIKTKFELGISYGLINDFQEMDDRNDEWNKFKTRKEFIDVKRFVFRNLRFLSNEPQLFIQQAFNEPDESFVKRYCLKFDAKPYNLSAYFTVVMVRNMSCPVERIMPFVDRVMPDAIACCLLHQSSPLLILGFVTGLIQSFDIQSFEVFKTMRFHLFKINSMVAIQKDANLVSVDENGKIAVWSIKEGVMLHELKGHTAAVMDCVYSSDTDILCTCGIDCQIITWKCLDFHIDNTFRTKSPINCATVHPHNNSKFAVGCWNGDIFILTFSRLKKIATLHQEVSVRSISFYVGQNLFISSDVKGRCYIWNSQKGQLIKTLKSDYNDKSVSFKHCPDGVSFMEYPGKNSRNTNISLWNRAIATENNKLKLEDPTCIDMYYNKIFYGSKSGRVYFFNLDNLEAVSIVTVCKSDILHVKIRNDSTVVVIDYNLNMYFIENLKSRLVVESVHSSMINSLLLTEAHIILATDDCTVLILKYDGDVVGHVTNFNGPVTCLTNNPKGLFAGSKDKSIALIDVNTGVCKAHQIDCHSDWVTCLLTISDSKLISGSATGEIQIWTILADPTETECLKNCITINGHTQPITGLCSKNWVTFMSSSMDGFINMWNVDGLLLDAFKIQSISDNEEESDSIVPVKWIQSFNDNGVISLGRDDEVRMFDFNKNIVATTIANHSDSVTDIGVGPEFIYSVSLDKTIKVWKTSELKHKQKDMTYNIVLSLHIGNLWEYADVLCTYSITGLLLFWFCKNNKWEIIYKADLNHVLPKKKQILSPFIFCQRIEFNEPNIIELHFLDFKIHFICSTKTARLIQNEKNQGNRVKCATGKCTDNQISDTIKITLDNEENTLSLTNGKLEFGSVICRMTLQGPVVDWNSFQNKEGNLIIFLSYEKGTLEFIDVMNIKI